jgi:hypothetical protein
MNLSGEQFRALVRLLTPRMQDQADRRNWLQLAFPTDQDVYIGINLNERLPAGFTTECLTHLLHQRPRLRDGRGSLAELLRVMAEFGGGDLATQLEPYRAALASAVDPVTLAREVVTYCRNLRDDTDLRKLVADYVDQVGVVRQLLASREEAASEFAEFVEPILLNGFGDLPAADALLLMGEPGSGNENVSWWQAVAFCRWLEAQRRLRRVAVPKSAPDTYVLRLPTEEEWEKAASWDSVLQRQRRYPWGDDERVAAYANVAETGIGQTVAVGLFPSGAAPCGAEDLVGNLLEWTTSNWTIDWPMRVYRGSSWQSDRANTPAKYRYRAFANDKAPDLGFRLVLSTPLPQEVQALLSAPS